jgi:hypothetical protein
VKILALSVTVSSLLLLVTPASATTSLNDWCFSVNGDISSCNGSGLSNSAVNLSVFDTTLNPNSLGTAVITLGPGSDQYVSFYADYDIDYSDYLSYNDNAATTNSLSSGQTFSIGDPNTYNGVTAPSGYTLFDAFANNTLDNSNTAGTPNSGTPQCCDIAFAIGFSGIDVSGGGSAVVTFNVSLTAPASGFYITQSSNDLAQPSIYVYGEVDQTTATPEPSTFLLMAGALAIVGILARRRRTA